MVKHDDSDITFANEAQKPPHNSDHDFDMARARATTQVLVCAMSLVHILLWKHLRIISEDYGESTIPRIFGL